VSAALTIEEVGLDTPIGFITNRVGSTRIVTVYAICEDGSDGPWLGSLLAVPWSKWPGSPPDNVGMMKLWEFYPVLKSNRYRLSKKACGVGPGKSGAALALRDYIAERNILAGVVEPAETR
jgi:hypothetical protein